MGTDDIEEPSMHWNAEESWSRQDLTKLQGERLKKVCERVYARYNRNEIALWADVMARTFSAAGVTQQRTGCGGPRSYESRASRTFLRSWLREAGFMRKEWFPLIMPVLCRRSSA
jgi:hypothetical protein